MHSPCKTFSPSPSADSPSRQAHGKLAHPDGRAWLKASIPRVSRDLLSAFHPFEPQPYPAILRAGYLRGDPRPWQPGLPAWQKQHKVLPTAGERRKTSSGCSAGTAAAGESFCSGGAASWGRRGSVGRRGTAALSLHHGTWHGLAAADNKLHSIAFRTLKGDAAGKGLQMPSLD